MKSANLPITSVMTPIYQTWGIKDKESTQMLHSAVPITARLFSLLLKSLESSNTRILLQK